MTKNITTQVNEIDFSTMSSVELITHFGGVSKAIRGLDQAKFTRMQISKMLGKRYQHVRNVLITPLTSKVDKD